jgi:hypothetical protein
VAIPPNLKRIGYPADDFMKQPKIKHKCKRCAKWSKIYAEESKIYARWSKECTKWSKIDAERSKRFANKCQCEGK